MATFSSTALEQVLPKTPIGPGLMKSVWAFSFNGTNPTATFVLPSASVYECVCNGTPLNTIDGSTPDTLVVNNSANSSSGLLVSLSATAGANCVVSITRASTNPQDAQLVLLTKG